MTTLPSQWGTSMDQPKFRLGQDVYVHGRDEPGRKRRGSRGTIVSIMQNKNDGTFRYTVHLDGSDIYTREYENYIMG